MQTPIGQDVKRKEAWEKATGRAVYTGDLPTAGVFAARLLTSTHAHARIEHIDTGGAWAEPGVVAVLTGDDCAKLFGPLLMDRPALARGVVRYAGEPVAMVVALDEPTAERALRRIDVTYTPLRAVLTPSKALSADAPLIHRVEGYRKTQKDVSPQRGANIASRYAVNKGDVTAAMARCDTVVEQQFSLPPSDHMAMEVRTARAEIKADGAVVITTSSQSPYEVQNQIAEAFDIPAGKIHVKVPFVGGGFGGKAPVTLEILAYLGSLKAGGRPVRVVIPREQEMHSMPGRIGLDARIRLGAARDGTLVAAELEYLVDCGAYSDIAPNMAKAVAACCTGPYRVENVRCASVCVYTNHTYATSYRSFAHESLTFCIERSMDILARRLGVEPLALRRKNALRPGDLTPTQVASSRANTGDLAACIDKLKAMLNTDASPRPVASGIVRATGVACLWKSATPPTDAVSGALVTANPDGSFNLNTGVVEMGSGGQTQLAQMLAQRLKIDVSQVHVVMPVDTMLNPRHWKTVASITGYMAGNAVMRAADDILRQLRQNGAQAFYCPEDEVEIAHGRVFRRQDPAKIIEFKDIVQGYKTEDDVSIGEPVLGRGGFKLKGLSALDPNTGKGKTGPAYTVGAQAVEVEVNVREFTYRILKAATVMDVGCAINPEAMRAMIMGGMAMGISLSSREHFMFDDDGVPRLPTLRTYKLLHIGQEPVYSVEFVQTPQDGAPFGVRAYSEHGIIGIPAALANALGIALGIEPNKLPLTPENLWRQSREGAR